MKTKSQEKKTILLIEDEKSLLEVIKAKLEKSDFNVMTSRSVERAFSVDMKKNRSGNVTSNSVAAVLAYLESLEKVDAIWLDHNLLGEDDGLDFVTKFKSNGDRWKDVPIFVVSNTSDAELVDTYKKLGVSKYYVKSENKLENIISDINLSLLPAGILK